MLEAIATVCRILACEARLIMLYQLSLEPELQVSLLARRAGISPDLASQHLRHLTSCGLVERRRSGRYVYCLLPASAAPAGSFRPLPIVRRALLEPSWAARGWKEEKLGHLSSPAAAALPADIRRALDIVFDAATAFGHVRRLRMLRLFMQHRTHSLGAMATKLRMSPQACWRHLDKLRRRGYVHESSQGSWSVSRAHKTRLHASLLAMVRSALK